ncbi:unnamed protein product [Echinostoma caproni]|uniref:Protein kinase domain-containing protein n=1 Tax=Echinostoma caproni TaxID=27848 RepID=A0A183AAK2_9TREM|nr:unnamed protein product [Echinostoma caproni]
MCRKYDAVADIWSMGIIVYQCLTGKAPFYASNPEALKNIYETSPCLKPKIPVTTSQLLRDLLLRMLVRKPSDRIDFAGARAAAAAAAAANTPVRSRRDLPSRADNGGTVIGTLGLGTGDGPYYLTERNHVNTRDKTPQRHPTVNKVHPPTHLAGRTFAPSSASPAYLDTQTPSPGLNIDDVDDEMSRTTVDEYFEDELDSSTLPLETTPHTMVNYAPNVPESTRGGYNTNAPPVPCRGSSVGWKATTGNAHQTQTHAGYPRPPHMSGRPSAELETGENHVDDFVLVNSGGAEVDRYSRALPYPGTEHYPLSNVGQIVTNPTAYLANHPRLQHTESPPLPDVAVVGAKGDGHIPPNRPGMLTQKGPATHGGYENPTVGNRIAGRPPNYPPAVPLRYVGTPSDQPGCPDVNEHFTARGPSEPTTFQPHPPSRGQWPQPQNEPLAARTSNESDQMRLPNRVTPTGPVEPVTLGQASSEFPTAAHPIRIRPYSGGGILEYAANVPNGVVCGGVWAAAEFSDEQLMDSQHNEAIKTITMVLELCELLSELAERRASVLSDCMATPLPEETIHTSSNSATDQDSQTEAPVAESDTTTDTSDNTDAPTGGLKFLPEARRIVEQIVLYRRVLYYLEYVFDQVKKSCRDRRLKSTATARRRLRDCNTLYHRCYIRLRQLARQSRRDDLIEPVGRLLANITANRLIFQYALVQCQAAEMDEYVGDIAQSLQRYKAGITLLHGLRQHARTVGDKTLLADCMRLLHDRINALRTTAAKAHREGCFAHSGGFADASSSPASERSGTPLQRATALDQSYGDSPSGVDCTLAEASPLASSPIR